MSVAAAGALLVGSAILSGLSTDELLLVSSNQRGIPKGKGFLSAGNHLTASAVEENSRFDKAMSLKDDESKAAIAKLVCSAPDLSKQGANSLFYEVLALTEFVAMRLPIIALSHFQGPDGEYKLFPDKA